MTDEPGTYSPTKVRPIGLYPPGHTFWTPERLALSARGLSSSTPTPDGSKLSADQLKTVIAAWLYADDPTHWGDFERALFAAIENDEAMCAYGEEREREREA